MKCKMLFVFVLLLFIVTLAHAQITLLNENFEGSWPPTGWYVDSTTLTTEYALSYSHSVKFDAITDVMRTPMVVGPTSMSFYHRWLSSNDPTQFWVQISTSESGPWTNLGSYQAGPPWTKQEISLIAYHNSSVYIRFALQSDNPSPSLYIDDVLIQRCPFVPVELASFTANVVHQNDQDMVQINWTTHSETEVSGYSILRSDQIDPASAMQINTNLIEATNSSTSTNYSYVDNEVQPGTLYYWLQSNDMNGSVQLFGPISVKVNGPQGEDPTPQLSISTQLQDAYPNPFNPRTTIPFLLTSKASVKLEIFNQKGQLVWTYDQSNADPGLYRVNWDGRDMNGRDISSGVYLCKMVSNNYRGFKKLILQK